MVYMGSKRQYCKYIVPIIQKYINENYVTTFIDCFCGGANLADKINCQKIICNDLSPTLIALHQQAQKDFSKIPTQGDKELWNKAYNEWKNVKLNIHNNLPATNNITIPLFEIGALEWYGSYSAGGFPRGYANSNEKRNYYNERYCNHKKQCENPIYKKISFIYNDYQKIKIPQNEKTILYCDAPYKNTKSYGISPKFNFNEYYNWIKEISLKVPIFISEQEMPDEFNKYIIWEKEAKRTIGASNNYKSCEKLYLIDNVK